MRTSGSSAAQMQSQQPCSLAPSPAQRMPLRTPSAYHRGRRSPCCVSAFNRHTWLSRHSQIAALSRTAAIGLGCRQFRERLGLSTVVCCIALICLNLCLVALDELARLLLGPRDLGLPPAGWSPAVPVLDEKMCCANLVARTSVVGRRDTLGAVVGGHVLFQLLWVSARRRLPSRVLCPSVEIVRQIFAVGVADFPALGQSCFVGRLRALLVACQQLMPANNAVAHHDRTSEFYILNDETKKGVKAERGKTSYAAS